MQRNEQVSEFKEKLVAVNRVSKTVNGLDVAPGAKGEIQVGAAPADAEALVVKATDNTGMEIFTWVF